jgi:hypothetical protein
MKKKTNHHLTTIKKLSFPHFQLEGIFLLLIIYIVIRLFSSIRYKDIRITCIGNGQDGTVEEFTTSCP